MKSQQLFTSGWSPRLICVLALVVLLGQGRAHALTKAGSEIRNQSVATYLDGNGKNQTTTSNEVINVVATVDGVEITPDGGASVADDPLSSYGDTPALNQVTAPGNIAYYHYNLQNTGNSDDTYTMTVGFDGDTVAATNGDAIDATLVRVYYDANGDGRVDPGDVLLREIDSAGTQNAAVATPLVGPDRSIPLIVAVHTPVTAVEGDAIYADIQATSAGGGATDDRTNLNKTTFDVGKGVLTVLKSANVSSASPGDTLTYTIEGSNTGNAAVYSVPDTSADIAPIDIDGDDDVDAADVVDGVLISDDLDETKLAVGAAYAGVSVTVNGPSQALVLYWDQTNSRWTTDKADAEFTDDPKIALFIPDSDSTTAPGDDAEDPVLQVGQGFKFTFTVDIVAGLAETTVLNQAEAIHDPDGTGGDDPETVPSNISRVTVGGDVQSVVTDVAIGPYTWPKADNGNTVTVSNGGTRPANATSDTPQHPAVEDGKDLTSAKTSDITTAGVRDAGEVIAYPLTVLNPSGTSTTDDVFNISYSAPESGYAVVLYKSDGITPLADTNGDGIVDTGTLAPGEYADIVVMLYLDADLDDANGTSVTITATSTVKDGATDSYKTNTTTINVAEVEPAGVDIATSGQLGGDNADQSDATATQPDDDDATAASVTPGSTLLFDVDIANMRNAEDADGAVDETTSAMDTYQLSVTPSSGPPDASAFTVALFKDANGDGTLADSELRPISDTDWLDAVADVDAIDPAEIFSLIVRVQVPVGTAAGDYYLDVTAQSTNNPNTTSGADSMRIKITVVNDPKIELIPDNTATVVAGGSFIFRHVLNNVGNVADTVTLTHSTLPDGYSAVFIDCTDGSVKGTGSTYTTALLAAGASEDVCLKVFVPANAPTGSTVPITVTADMANFDVATYAASTDTAVDVVNVIDGALRLTKTNDPTTAVAPDGTIEYTTEYLNLSPGDLTVAKISDAIPANTTITVTDGTITGTLPDGTTVTTADAADLAYFEYSTDGGLNWTTWPADETTLTAADITNIRFVIGTVGSGESGDFVFQVTVD
jgi:hypothetical protein